MRVAELIVASCILAASGAGVALAQFVDPLRVLEESRRERLEMDKRLAREAAARRQKEKAEQAAQADAQRKLEKERAASATGAPTTNTPSPHLEHSSAREIIPGAPIPTTAPASADVGTPAPNQPVAASAREETALPSGSAMGTADGMPLPSQAGAASAHEIGPGVPIPSAPASSASIEAPAANPPVAPSPPEAAVETPIPTPPRVLITVDKAAQQMRVTVDGKLRHSWAVSTGRAQFETPTGTFRPLYLAKKHYSKEWDDAPMPHSIFFTDRGHAIHASNATRRLGRRASHGCVRLAPSKAAALFALVQAEGVSTTKVTITNGTSARKAVRSRTVDARARKRVHVRRASSDSWQIGPRVGWTE
jgi:lipoprotein-anchoring transpeptidase ErfK/SrfK